MLMTSDAPKLGFRKGLMYGDFTVEVVWLEAVQRHRVPYLLHSQRAVFTKCHFISQKK